MLELPRLRPTDHYPEDAAERAIVDAFIARGQVLANRWINKVKRQVRDVRVVDIPDGGHYVFLTREGDVLREIHAFVARAPSDAHRALSVGTSTEARRASR